MLSRHSSAGNGLYVNTLTTACPVIPVRGRQGTPQRSYRLAVDVTGSMAVLLAGQVL